MYDASFSRDFFCQEGTTQQKLSFLFVIQLEVAVTLLSMFTPGTTDY